MIRAGEYSNTLAKRVASTLETFRIEPDDVIIIIRRNPAMMYWIDRVYCLPFGMDFNP